MLTKTMPFSFKNFGLKLTLALSPRVHSPPWTKRTTGACLTPRGAFARGVLGVVSLGGLVRGDPFAVVRGGQDTSPGIVGRVSGRRVERDAATGQDSYLDSRGKGWRNVERREFALSASRVNCWGGRSAPDRQAPRVLPLSNFSQKIS